MFLAKDESPTISKIKNRGFFYAKKWQTPLCPFLRCDIMGIQIHLRRSEMTKIARRILIGLAAALLLAAFLVPGLARRADAAETPAAPAAETATAAEDAVEPRLFATLTLSMRGEGTQKVFATVKNEFTLFPSTVQVLISLYASAEFTTDYNKMSLQTSKLTEDLNMGSTLEVSASTSGKTLYWLARVEYRENGGAWKTLETGPLLYDGNGNHIEQ